MNKDRIVSLMLEICAGRTTLAGGPFVKLLEELVEAAAQYDPKRLGRQELHGKIESEELPPQIKPMRTKEDALRVYRETHPEIPPPIVKKPQEWKTKPPPIVEIEVRKPAPEVHPSKPLGDEEKDIIRRRYKQAKTGRVRVERGWVRRIAEEYGVSDSYIYNIIYTDSSYVAVPRTE
jgi:hypothetical protein